MYIYIYIRNHTEVDRIWSLHTYSRILVSFFFECSIYFRNVRMTIGGNGIRVGISDGRIRYLGLEVVWWGYNSWVLSEWNISGDIRWDRYIIIYICIYIYMDDNGYVYNMCMYIYIYMYMLYCRYHQKHNSPWTLNAIFMMTKRCALGTAWWHGWFPRFSCSRHFIFDLFLNRMNEQSSQFMEEIMPCMVNMTPNCTKKLHDVVRYEE